MRMRYCRRQPATETAEPVPVRLTPGHGLAVGGKGGDRLSCFRPYKFVRPGKQITEVGYAAMLFLYEPFITS